MENKNSLTMQEWSASKGKGALTEIIFLVLLTFVFFTVVGTRDLSAGEALCKGRWSSYYNAALSFSDEIDEEQFIFLDTDGRNELCFGASDPVERYEDISKAALSLYAATRMSQPHSSSLELLCSAGRSTLYGIEVMIVILPDDYVEISQDDCLKAFIITLKESAVHSHE